MTVNQSKTVQVVTKVSEPLELTEADLQQIAVEARQAQEAMRKTIAAMELLTADDVRVRAR